MLPNLVILGAQKSATSAVQLGLATHPDVYMVRPEVTLFEDPNYGPDIAAQLARLLPRGREPRYFGIKRPDYLTRPEVPPRVVEHLPDARLVAVLRHPLQRAVSAYYHYLRYSFLTMRPLNEGMRAILDGDQGEDFSPAGAVLAYGRYRTGIDRWLQHFSRERLLVLLHEDFERDEEGTLGRLQEFLELSPAPGGMTTDRRPNEGVYSYARIRILRFVQRFSNVVRPETNHWDWRWGPFGMGLYFLTRQMDKKILARFCQRRPDPLDDDVQQRLLQYYEPETAGIEELLGRDLPQWRQVP